MYQSLRTVLNVKSTYQTVSDRISDYKNLLEDFNDKVIKRKHIEQAAAPVAYNTRSLTLW